MVFIGWMTIFHIKIWVGGCSLNFADFFRILASNFSSCNNQGTLSSADDTFTADITVSFTNAPTTGNLHLSGNMHCVPLIYFRTTKPLDGGSFEQVVRDYLMRYEKGIVEDYTLSVAEGFRERVDDIGFLGATLEEDYTVGLTDYFPINYQSYYFLTPVRSLTDQINLSSAAYSEEFFIRAFSLAPGEVSSPVLLDDQAVDAALETDEDTDIACTRQSDCPLDLVCAAPRWVERMLEVK